MWHNRRIGGEGMQTASDYMRDRRQDNRLRAIQFLCGKCSNCRSLNNLEFDHINHISRTRWVNQLLSCSWRRITKELMKCQLLCNSCHLKKTLKDIGKKPWYELHGTVTRYKNYNCRCESCRVAHAEWFLSYVKKKRASNPLWGYSKDRILERPSLRKLATVVGSA